MKSGIKVGDIMTRNFVSVNPETSLIECAREMMKKRVGSLVLREGTKLIGLLTEKDVLKLLVAIIALLLVGGATIDVIPSLNTYLRAILENFVLFVGAAGLVVAIKAIIESTKK